MTKKEVTQLAYNITGCAIRVHKELGPGLLENIYEKCLKHELELNGMKVTNQVIIPIEYKGLKFDSDLRIDLVVNNKVIVEIKAIEKILPIHEAQVLTYMKMLKIPQGLLINFHTDNIVKSLKPFVNNYFKDLENS